jgi:hypothetical protein
LNSNSAQHLVFATGRLHWDGPEGLGQLFVLAGVVADLAIVLDGRIAYWETEWNVIEFYDFLIDWTDEGRASDFVYGDNIEGHESPPAFYREGADTWIVRGVRSDTGPVVTTAALNVAVDDFLGRIALDFEALVGVGLVDWMRTTGRQSSVRDDRSAVPEEIREEVRSILRGRGQDWMSLEGELARLIRDNPDWHAEIGAAVMEVEGDLAYDWQAAMAVLRDAGIPVPDHHP